MSKTVLITGASRGIGKATAEYFANRDYNIVVNYNNSEEAALKLCDSLQGKAVAIKADVSDTTQVESMIADVVKKFGKIDVLVCNAGIALPLDLIQNYTDEQFERIMSINVGGVFKTVRAVVPHMVREQYGSIITISSMWGQVGGSCESLYSASKGAIIAFTKAIAQELAPSHIRANCVAPGVIDTDMMSFAGAEVRENLADETPLGALGQAEDVASAVYFLASEQSKFITGQVLAVNGGFVIT